MLYDIPRLDGSVRYSVFFSLLPFLGLEFAKYTYV